MDDKTIDLNALDEALRSAFPTRASLDGFLFLKFGSNLENYVGSGGLRDIVPQLLRALEAEHKIPQLLEAAHRQNPTNPLLRRCYESYFSLNVPPATLEKIVQQENPFHSYADWLKRQQQIMSRVCRIDIDGQPSGTGFLVGSSAVLTNYHVIGPPSQEQVAPQRITCRFDYVSADAPAQVCKLSSVGVLATSPFSPLDLEPDAQGEATDEHLDFALLQLAEPLGDKRGIIELLEQPYPFVPRSPLFIVQHPEGQPLQVAVDTEAILQLNGNRTRVRYRTNTLAGSSGSPCFNASWALVALHHAGDPKKHPKGKTFGLYNEGIPIDRIYARLKSLGLLPHLTAKAPPSGTLQATSPHEVAPPSPPPSPSAAAPRPYQLVFCYAPADSGVAVLLEKQLAGLVAAKLIAPPWNEALIPPGAITKVEIQRHWDAAEILVLLISADFLADHQEYLRAAEERQAQGATVIPILVRPALISSSWLSALKAYPRDSRGTVKAISKWQRADDGWFNVIEGIQAAIAARRASAGTT